MYAGGDVEPVRALLTEDIAWHVPGDNAIAGVYRGIDAVLDYFRRRRAVAGNSLQLQPGELLVGDQDHLASLTDGTAIVNGVQHTWSTVGLYRTRNGKISACWLLPLDQNAFDQVWSV
jgi:ketosteroid isomerase-like protein